MTSPTAPSDGFVRPAAFELRMALLFSAQFLSSGVAVPYLPLWLAGLGFSPEQIALVLAAPLFVRVPASTLVSALADRARDRVPVLLACALASAALCTGLFVFHTYGAILVLSLLLAAVWGPHVPLVDSLALSGVRRFGSNYALMRGAGSVAFLLTNVGAGYVVAAHGAGTVPTMMLASFVLLIAMTVIAPRLGRPRRQAPLPGDVLPGQASLLGNREFVLFIAAGAMIMASHAHFYTFGSIYWRELGLPEDVIGWLWAFSVVCEVMMFALARPLFAGWRPASMLMVGGAVAVLRWVAMPIAGAAGAGAGGFLVLQALHAATFSVTFIATQRLMAERIGEERMGAAQALMTFANGFMLALFTLAAGPLWRAFGPPSFLAMALAGAAGVALAIGSLRSAPQRG